MEGNNRNEAEGKEMVGRNPTNSVENTQGEVIEPRNSPILVS